MMLVSRSHVVAGLFALAAAAPCLAADVVPSIPADALGFVVLNRVGEMDAKLAQAGRLLQLPIPGLSALAAKAGLTEGLDGKGSAAVVALPSKDGPIPAVLLYLPVTDFQKFLAPLGPDNPSAKVVQVQVMGQPAVAASRPGFAILARPRDRAALEQAVGASQNVADQLPSFGAWQGEQDVLAVATRTGVQLLAARAKDGLNSLQKASRRPAGPMCNGTRPSRGWESIE